MAQYAKDRDSDPKGSDAIDDDDDEGVLQTLLTVIVEGCQRHHDPLAKGQGEEYLLTGIRPHLKLKQLFEIGDEVNEDS